MKTMNSYNHISDEDVEGVVRYMQIFHPDKANPEYCRTLLEALYAGAVSGFREIALSNPDDIEELYEKYEAYIQTL